jgi:hypothetical protein
MAPDENPKDPKPELLTLFAEGQATGQQIVELGGAITRYGQEMRDLSGSCEKVMRYPAPSGFNPGFAVSAWQNYVADGRKILLGAASMFSGATTTAGCPAASAMAPYANEDAIVTNVESDDQPQARADVQQLRRTLDNTMHKDEVISLFKRFGLDKARPGKQSPLEQFEIAWATFEKPPITTTVPAVASLIPIRESIEETIERLLLRRPHQEAARNWDRKVESIGKQLDVDGTSPERIVSLANRWSKLQNELSGAKIARATRDEWHIVLITATLILAEMLSLIDPSKLRGLASD